MSSSRLQLLSLSWTQAAAAQGGAAPITFVNEVDDEDDPFDLGFDSENRKITFRYLESVANVCDCQGISELVDKDGKNINAYTAEGLFKFSSRYNPLASGIEVIECNQYCSCTLYECSNRVAQRPRTVPIEIFKTEPEDTDKHSKSSKRGWGVRCTTQDIKKGTVLGCYTGEIVHRQTANRLQGNHGTYVFDLDGRDPPPDEELDPNSQLYSIDARNCGNWTRFLNHSCHSNLAVYTAVWDTLPEQNIPHLVFFALENIPKGTEMTVDYHAGTPLPKQKRRNVKSRPPGTNECFCGAKRCRGWV
ncbi:SET domain-containing protein [Lentinula raphanica]|nr:SET domain-containing protein [Lentinula raphanica]